MVSFKAAVCFAAACPSISTSTSFFIKCSESRRLQKKSETNDGNYHSYTKIFSKHIIDDPQVANDENMAQIYKFAHENFTLSGIYENLNCERGY